MKKFKKIFSFALAMLMLLSVVTGVLSVLAADEAEDLPIIYVPGRSDTLYNTETKEKVYPIVDDEVQYTKDCAKEIAKALAKAVATEAVKGQKAWDEYCDVVVEKVSYMFTSIQLDENGNAKDNTGVLWNASTAYVNPKTSGYNLYDYSFQYDWRLDPMEIAAQLRVWVDRVKAATGKSQVKMYVHCLGGTIFSAYLAQYGSDDLEGVVLSVPTVTGSGTVGALYSNQIVFDPDALSEYATYYLNSSQNRFFDDDPAMIALMTAVVTTLNEAKALGVGTDMMTTIYNKVKNNMVPRLIKSCFFFPTYYAMIGDDYYQAAKDLVFTGDFAEQYAGYIEKIDNYHYNVQVKAADLLEQAKENGTKISIIARYGFNLLPVFEGCDTLGDGRMETSKLSYGATTSTASGKLSASYIAKQEEAGLGSYISADQKIDASTCLFPDSTWFIRNLYHAGINPIDSMAMTLFKSAEQPTIYDYEEYPQFMNYNDDGSFSAVTGDSEQDTIWVKDIKSALIRLLTAFFKILTALINK